MDDPMIRVFAEHGLKHASMCVNSDCQLQSCMRLKQLINHAPTCEVRAHRGCVACKEYWDVLGLHAKTCRNPKCVILHCEDLRPKRKSLVKTALSTVGLPFVAIKRTFSRERMVNNGDNPVTFAQEHFDVDDDDDDEEDVSTEPRVDAEEKEEE